MLRVQTWALFLTKQNDCPVLGVSKNIINIYSYNNLSTAIRKGEY
jgi:hypothetical protein